MQADVAVSTITCMAVSTVLPPYELFHAVVYLRYRFPGIVPVT